MNGDIQKLWAQCVIKHTKTPMNWQTVADEFAELIIRECADWIDRQDESRCPYGVDLIEHFGVE